MDKSVLGSRLLVLFGIVALVASPGQADAAGDGVLFSHCYDRSGRQACFFERSNACCEAQQPDLLCTYTSVNDKTHKCRNVAASGDGGLTPTPTPVPACGNSHPQCNGTCPAGQTCGKNYGPHPNPNIYTCQCY